MSSWWPQSSQRSPGATKSKITPHYALWSAAACCFGCGWKCSIALKAQASLRTPKKSHKNVVRKTQIDSVVAQFGQIYIYGLRTGGHGFSRAEFRPSGAKGA